jgi:hypothetical protein
MMIVKNLFLFILLNLLSFSMIAQDRGEGAWWPSIHGADDEAGATNYVTPTKIMEALSLPQEGKVYELGHPYERIQPAYLDRPYRLNIVKRASPTS